MQRLLTSVFVALVFAVGLAAPDAGAAAQVSVNTPTCPPEGLWMAGPDGAPQLAPDCQAGVAAPGAAHSLAGNPSRPALATSTGGPDDFGYTWNDTEALNWYDATGGTDTGLFNRQYTGPVSLPFSFKYYENTYNSLYIAADGYLTLSDNFYYTDQSRLPAPGRPNNVIAPYWSPLSRNSSGPGGRVFYASGGSSPNRFFVVEWNQLPSASGLNDDGNFTFEVVLNENGDIVLRYGNMHYDSSHSYWCGTSGIEDSTGLIGLNYLSFCSQAPSNKAVHFFRPAPSRRVSVYPAYQGQFGHANEVVAFTVPVKNTGDQGSDTYDVTDSSIWPVSLFAADGTTPLTNTGGDGNPDTGPVGQGSTVNIVVKVNVPGGAALGDRSDVNLTFRSAANPGVSRWAVLQTSVPTSFAQVFMDTATGAQSLYLAAPSGHALRSATSNHHYGYNQAVATAPNGNLVDFWNVGRCLGTGCSVFVDELEYTLFNSFGELVRGVTKLTDNGGAANGTYDYYPAVAVAPDGTIGIIWIRELQNHNGSTYSYNYNVYFASLNSAGNLLSGPTNLTNNSTWFDYSNPGIGWMGNPTVAATGDNHFVMSWLRGTYAGSGCSNSCYPEELLYAARTSAGAEVKPATLLASVAPGTSDSYFGAGLARLNGNRALLTFEQHADVQFLVLDSAANIVQGATSITTDGTNQYDYDPDAVQLSGGNIVVAWTTSSGSNIRYAVLNAGYALSSGPTTLSNPAAITGGDYVSVAADGANRAVLTWMDADYSVSRNLYYALVESGGAIVTQPVIFQSSTVPGDMYTSYLGSGNTSLSPVAGVDTWVRTQARSGATPGGSGVLPVSYGNHGTTLATSVTVTLTLGVGVTYLSDSSGVSPTIVGNTVVWTLPDLNWLDTGQFDVAVGIPNVPFGTNFSVGLATSANAPDVNSADNAFNAQIFAAHLTYLPTVSRQ